MPLPAWACCLMLTPATALLITLLVLPALRLDWHVLAWTLGTVVGEYLEVLFWCLLRCNRYEPKPAEH